MCWTNFSSVPQFLPRSRDPVERFHISKKRAAGMFMIRGLIVSTIYLQLIQNRYMFRSFTVLQCSHQHCVQPVASDVEVVEYI